MRREVAIFTLPVHAHVLPVLPLCLELKMRGYRVTYVTTEAHIATVRSVHAEPIVIKPKNTRSDAYAEEKWRALRALPSDDPAWWSMYAAEAYPESLAFATDVLSQVGDVYNASTPDLILYDPMSFAGRILAHRLSLPAVQIFGSFAANTGFLYRQEGRYVNPAPMLAFCQELDCFLQEHGIRERANLWHVERLNIHFIPREFQYEPERFDERFCFAGACLNRPYRSCWQDRSEGRPIILVSHLSDPVSGADVEYFKLFRDALGATEWHVILSLGKYIDAESLAPLPSNIELNRVASHLEILPHAALFIGQAGTGSTLEALYNGVPPLLLPVTPFHEEVAYRVVELGLGSRLSRVRATRNAVREIVSTMIKDSVLRNRVNEMRKTFQLSGGAKLAADRIEQFLDPAASP